MDTLQKQKEHNYTHVHGRQPPPVSEELQKKFDHGTKNEVNTISTLISTVVPVYLPACYAFYEVGAAFIGSEEKPHLIEVSADGILQCSFGHPSCPNYAIHGEQKIAVEIKSPTPHENVAETIFYDVPNRYVPQILSEMKAYGCEELWLVCSTAISASVISYQFDNDLWMSFWNLAWKLYSAESPNIPTKLDESIKQLKLDISSSKQRCSKLLCEVPTVTGEYGNITVDLNLSSPYSPAPGHIEIHSTSEQLSIMSENLSVNAASSFQECHQVLRDPGKELLVFMLTDKDRKQHKDIPYSYPIAYALKGSCMTNSHLDFMVSKVHSELQKRSIPILCETYDGQWHKFITEDHFSRRLTKLHGKETWNKFANMSKDKCIEHINQISVVKKSTLEKITNTTLPRSHGILFPGIRIEKGKSNELFIQSEQRKMGNLRSVHYTSRPDLFEIVEIEDETETVPESFLVIKATEPHKRFMAVSKFSQQQLANDNSNTNTTKQKTKRTVGLKENERSLLDILKPNTSVDEELDNTNVDNFAERNDNLTLENILRHPNCPLLHNILNELINTNTLKWSGKTCDDLFPEILTDGNVLIKNCTVKELQVIANEMQCCTG